MTVSAHLNCDTPNNKFQKNIQYLPVLQKADKSAKIFDQCQCIFYLAMW